MKIIGSGIYNLDIILRRSYPEGFEIGRRNPFVDTIHSQEVGGTCGNVMCTAAEELPARPGSRAEKRIITVL